MDTTQLSQSTDAVNTDLPPTKLMNGGIETTKSTKISGAEQKDISDGSDDDDIGSEQETAEYMNGMESTDVQDIVDDEDEDDEEDDDEEQNLENHFSMQAEDDFEEEEEKCKLPQAQLDELQQTIFFQGEKLREYESKINEYESLQYQMSQNDKFNDLYFELLQSRNKQDALNKKAVNEFKKMIIFNLRSLRSDYAKQQSKIQKLQSAVNAANMERRKIAISRDKMLKQKENENKALKTKNNESKSEFTRIKLSVDKIKRENALEKEQIIKKISILEKEKKALSVKLEKEKELVEKERREKLAVSDKNGEYLRNEKMKISKALDKERSDRHRLEERVSLLEDECNEKALKMEQYMQQNKKLTQTEKSQQNMAERAIKEKEESMAALLAKTKYFKSQQTVFDETKIQIETLQKQNENQRSEIKQLHESIRKKSEKEKEFGEIRKKLSNREKKLDEREKMLKSKYRQNGSSRTKQREYSSPSKQSRKLKEFSESKDPLYAYRNLLPFHWISFALFLILMLAIAQKK